VNTWKTHILEEKAELRLLYFLYDSQITTIGSKQKHTSSFQQR